MADSRPEVWLRGAVDGVPDLLQPVAHALLQVREEIPSHLQGFPDALLWERPGGVASVGFHLQHIAGVIDRLFTYARGEALSAAQLEALRQEGSPPGGGATVTELLRRLDAAVDAAVAHLRTVDPSRLAEPRGVGRAQLPSTVLGLLVHAAEHAQRHTGQLLVTARTLAANPDRRGDHGG